MSHLLYSSKHAMLKRSMFKPSAENVCEERQYLSLSVNQVLTASSILSLSVSYSANLPVRTTTTPSLCGLNNTSSNVPSLLFISLSLGLLYLLLHGWNRFSSWTLSGPLSVVVSRAALLHTWTSIHWHHLRPISVHILNVDCDFGSFRFNELELVLLLAIQP